MTYKLTPYNLQELGQRENQEDSLFPGIGQQNPNDRLFILCDGMGGHDKGEVASATVCQAMSNTILSRWNPNEPLSDELLQQAIEDAYDALDALQTPSLRERAGERLMGTTMTFVCFHADGVTVAHIGDSRVYQLRPATMKEPSRIVFKTRDHSLVNDLIEIGEITEEEAKSHPQKNVITRAMQPCQERRAKASISHLTDIQNGDYFYMCSDGMLEQTTDDNLLFIITNQKAADEEKIEMFREVTKENHDNHTAHLIYIDKVEDSKVTKVVPKPHMPQGTWIAPDSKQATPQKKSFLPMIIAAIVIAAIAIASSFFLFGSKTEPDENTADSTQTNTEVPSDNKDSSKVKESHSSSSEKAKQGKTIPVAPSTDAPSTQEEATSSPTPQQQKQTPTVPEVKKEQKEESVTQKPTMPKIPEQKPDHDKFLKSGDKKDNKAKESMTNI